MSRINLLPKWVLPDAIPSVYDCTSGSWVEMAAKLYGAMTELQTDYNSFVDELNKTIDDFINNQTIDRECFEQRMTKTIHDYIDYLDMRVQTQDKVIANAVDFMKTNLSESVTTIIAEMKELGEFDEAILNAIDNIGLRVSELEKFKIEQNEKIELLTTDVVSLKQRNLTSEYQEENKKLIISLTDGGVE